MLNKDTLNKLLATGSTNQTTEDLSSYLNSANRNRRVNIPQISPAQLELEEVVIQLIQSFITSPCLIQIDYSQDSFSMGHVKTFISILVEQSGLWKGILKDQSWVSVGFHADKTNISFATSSIDTKNVESMLKTIQTKTTDIVSYYVHQNDMNLEISLNIDGLAHTKLTAEGSIL